MTRCVAWGALFLVFVLAAGTPRGAAAPFFSGDTAPLFEHLGREAGLSNLSVSSLVQDRYGFLWFGTQGGLNRYDGRYVGVINTNPFFDDGLVHDLIQTMYYDKTNHELWIGTYQGLSHYEIDKRVFTNYRTAVDGLASPIVVAIVKDHAGMMWVGTMNGLQRLDPEDGSLVSVAVPGDVVRSLEVDSDGTLWVGTYEGLYSLDADAMRLRQMEVDLPTSFVMVVREFAPGYLTLGLWDGGVVVVDVASKQTIEHWFDLEPVYTLLRTDDGTVWAGTWGRGLYALTADGRELHFAADDKGPLEHPVIYSLLQDRSGILWVGTNGGGLHKVNPRKRNYLRFSHDPQDPDSLGLGKINVIHRDQTGKLWMAVNNVGLYRYDENQDAMIAYRHAPDTPMTLPHSNVSAVLDLGEGRLLVGTNGGLALYQPEVDAFVPWDVLPSERLIYSLALVDGRQLWVGTYNHGVYRYDMLTSELEHFPHVPGDPASLPNNLVYAILPDSQGRVWIGTNDGLSRWDSDTDCFRQFRRQSGDFTQLGTNTIRALHEDSQGRIWVGMVGGGVARFVEETETFETLYVPRRAASNVITGILEGLDGRMWLATHGGLTVLDPDTFDYQVLTGDDGLGGWEFNSGHFRDLDGTLLFGGVHGITGIPSDATAAPQPAPMVYITDVSVFQESVDSDRRFFNQATLAFGSDERSIGFDFAALDYDLPHRTEFQYRLDGFDADWIAAGTRDYAAYANLPSGDYEFQVRAINADGVMSEPALVRFSVARPWYSQPWAFALYVLGFLALTFSMFKLWEGHLMARRNAQLAHANDLLKQISIRDSLTGVYNRRYFDTRLTEQIQTARRSRTPLSLLMLDIDDFKRVNDTYGHVAGDHVLADFAAVLSSVVHRSTDVVGRYGGDEFVVLLYDANAKGARAVAEDIAEAVKALRLREEFGGEKAPMTASIGLTTVVPDETTTNDSVLQAADAALYRAKELGKNQIQVDHVMRWDRFGGTHGVN